MYKGIPFLTVTYFFFSLREKDAPVQRLIEGMVQNHSLFADDVDMYASPMQTLPVVQAPTFSQI